MAWHAAGPTNPGGPNSGTCAAGYSTGFLAFSADQCILQYCDGDTWRGIGKGDPCACDPNPTELVAHWTFDEGSGSTANDASGGGNHGTISGASWAAGHIGAGALSFDGDDEVIIGNQPPFAFEYDAPFTIAAWVYTGGSSMIFSKADAFNGYQVGFGHGGSVGLFAFWLRKDDGGERYAYIDTNWIVPVSAWHHVVAVSDGTGTPDGMHLYVDGVEYHDGAIDGLGGRSILTGQQARIGAHGWGQHFSGGSIDDVRVYRGALSAAQVQELYDTGNVALACP